MYEKFGVRYLRITKRISTPTPTTMTTTTKQTVVVDGRPDDGGEDHESEEIEIEDEEDPEALFVPAPAAATTTPKNQDLDRIVQYDVVYSPSYQVPVLYLTFATASASTSKSKSKRSAPLPLPSPDEVYDMLVPRGFKGAMRGVGVMGALSMAEHPIIGVPAYFVHPCRTQEALGPLLLGHSSREGGGSQRAVDYLLLWFGVVGASVGLSVPVELARLLAERR